ncbi:MAG: hypothetical protein GY797_31425, partial [Deltaproteobacteria bacterium]|nr:hypothetical protein [Deltaproteobacteria bacterium]
KGLPIYWRKEKEIAKVIEIPQEDKVYITPDMYPTGKEPKCLIHEDERGTYYLREDVNKWRKEEYESVKKRPKDKISPKRIQNIIDAIPGVKWDPDSIEIVAMGYGDRPSFTMMGHIRELINKKVKTIKWHTHAPGGSYSRFYYFKDDSPKPISVKACLRNGQRVLDDLIKKLKVEK